MKKCIASVAAVLLACAALPSLPAFAADSADVYVTIADAAGKLALTQEKITVTDTDGDGALTINDALYLAHEAKYDGGAAAGFATAESTYGLSLAKLWGTENGGSYGYYVNHSAAMGMTDPITDGDYLDAFVYTDTTGWSDAYTWFNVRTASAQAGEELELQLTYAGFTPEWVPVELPVSGAVITIDGVETAFVTDADGKVTVTLDTPGEKVISAKSASQTLVPPALLVSVSAAETTTTEPVASAYVGTTTSTEATTSASVTTETTSDTTSDTTTNTTAATRQTIASSTTMTTTPKTTTTAAGTTASPSTKDPSGTAAAIVLAGAAAAASLLALSRKHED